MLTPDFTKAFARDRKKCVKKHWDIQALDSALKAVCASDETKLVPSYRDHALVGDLAGCRALHIGGRASNWVLIYEIIDKRVFFLRTGTHDDVFE
ncbi:MAG: type II toxin-antitoxin system YafQ family toxin [Bifidobacteriaceae bacterium]|jgi:mRNA interferase YafQ|nr:type II toxin-antitoxin system YafQ family toxin [Bifidobacteriaceae bacterium]